ncbi:MAG: haloacid dehalogenase-like hydrolase [Myxococcales bacterium]|nr:haloacid dehalogenase-like hydrolase [Myxococcales bacterium]
MEGVLVPRVAMSGAPVYLALNAQRIAERVLRLGNVMAAVPWLAQGPLHDTTTATRIVFMGLRGMSEDRLVELGRQYAETQLVPRLRPGCVELLREAARHGRRPVLLSDGIDVVVGPLADHLGVGDVLCNALEMQDGLATGRLREPVVSAALAVERVRQWADRHGVELSASAAYVARLDDQLLAAAVGEPCVVCPDRALRRLARDLDWPVLEA